MTNHEWLNSMTTLDLLDMISKRFPECLIYRINGCGYDAVGADVRSTKERVAVNAYRHG